MLTGVIAFAAEKAAPSPTPSPGATAGGGLISLLPLLLILAVFYFILIRPQQKEKKRHQTMLNGLKKGDKVITTGGIYGVIAEVKETTLFLKVGDEKLSTKIEVLKSAVSSLRE